jgi:hypothetical protein
MMRLYRALLFLYPAAFRTEYAEEMCAVFSRRRRDAGGWAGALALWIETVIDMLLTAAQVHWDMLRHDVRYAARALGRSPGFAIAAIVVAALGVGANTAVFSVTDHVLIRPLPFADAQRIVNLWEDQSYRGYAQNDPSPANFRDWKRMSTSFTDMAAPWLSILATRPTRSTSKERR